MTSRNNDKIKISAGLTIQDLLLSQGIKPTSQRNDIAKVMLEKPQHLSAEEVLILVNKKGAYVSKATVYNTLNLFVEKGLIRQVIIDQLRTWARLTASSVGASDG